MNGGMQNTECVGFGATKARWFFFNIDCKFACLKRSGHFLTKSCPQNKQRHFSPRVSITWTMQRLFPQMEPSMLPGNFCSWLICLVDEWPQPQLASPVESFWKVPQRLIDGCDSLFLPGAETLIWSKCCSHMNCLAKHSNEKEAENSPTIS